MLQHILPNDFLFLFVPSAKDSQISIMCPVSNTALNAESAIYFEFVQLSGKLLQFPAFLYLRIFHYLLQNLGSSFIKARRKDKTF